MAEDRIDSIVDPKAYKQIDDLTAKLALSQKGLLDNIDAAMKFNQALGNSKTLPDMEKNATAAAIAIEKLKQSQINTELAQARLTASGARAQQQQERATKSTNEQSREYTKLSNTLTDLRKKAQDVGAVFGTASKQFKDAQKPVTELDSKLKHLDDQLGVHSRDVGDYANKIKEGLFDLLPFGSEIGRAARAVEDFAPVLAEGAETVGLFTISLVSIPFATIGAGIAGLTAYFTTTQDGIDAVTRSVTPFKIAMKQALGELQEFGRGIADLFDPTKIKTLAPKSIADVFAELNKKGGVRVGANGALSDDQKKNIEAGKQIVDLQTQIEKNDITLTREQAKLNLTFQEQSEIARNTQLVGAEGERKRKEAAEKAIEANKELAALQIKDIDLKIKLLNIQQGLTKEGTLSREGQLELARLEAEKDQTLGASIQARRRITSLFNKLELGEESQKIKDEIELNRAKTEAIKDAALRVTEDETQSLDVRLDALKVYETQSEMLIKDGLTIELQTAGISATKKEALTIDSENKIAAIQLDAFKKREAINKKALDELKKDLTSGAKELDRVDQEIINNIKAYGDKRLSIVQQQSSDLLDALNLQYAKGLISTQKYNQEKYRIEAQSGQDSIAIQIDVVKQIIAKQQDEVLFDATKKKDLATSEQQLADLQIKLSKEVNSQKIKDAQDANEKLKIIQAEQIKLAEDVAQIAINLVDGQYDKQKNAIQGQIDAVEIQKQKEIDAVNATVLSSQEKANQLAIIDIRATARKEELARKQKQIDQDKARFDRLISIARVVELTAEAVARDLFGNKFLIPFDLAIGAAQIAAILATPIPAFKEGGKMDHTGLAEYGHGTELRIDPDGKISLTKNTPEIGLVQKGTQFVSNPELIKMLAKPDPIQWAGGIAIDLNKVVEATENSGKRVEKAIAGLRQKQGGLNYYSTSKGCEYLKRNL